VTPEFDLQAFFEAVDQRRCEHQLSWSALATTLWEQSRVLNDLRNDHPISASPLKRLAQGRGISCQHALFVLRWLGVPPETFITAPNAGTVGKPLPQTDDAHRLRWNLKKLHEALNDARTARDATWQQTALHLHCTPHQLTGLRSAKFATSMQLAMRITQALHRPAADFVYVSSW
jgi:hypothetical protein